MKESDTSESSPDRPDARLTAADRDNLDAVYQAEKDDQVMSSKEGKARWKGELASNSEASVGYTAVYLRAGLMETNR